ncbi:coth protein-domain-containing protein [Mucor mucedo]|uniref:coth protein-domain-containing protein n=1 Tax=Mucor mucedo TaxID=29922 RepID=UPI00221E8A80|nr:coth protein-domain-containing protein [Mucor mucedo]KAI7890835.1 coth protein-domain-containing protein [Mucor mucedo]
MRSFVSYFGLAILSLQLVKAADIEYAVVAFPQAQQSVTVVIAGQAYPLSPSAEHPNLFKGIAPSGDQYAYALGDVTETPRTQAQGIASTGNEFFNRTQTLFNVPSLPQAYHPIYHPLMSNMNRSNEVATIIMNTNATGLGEILTNPLGDYEYTEVYNMTYISHGEIFSFSMAGLKNSGKSTKEFAKQSYKLKLNEFLQTGDKQLLFGRSVVKLRAHETDPTFVREKLMLDLLAASGAASLEGSFVRLFINGEAFGLYLMIDDATDNFINNVLRAGNQKFQYTGPTYKGNAMTPEVEGNLVYTDDLPASYNDTIYEVADEGNYKKTFNKTTEKDPLIQFIRDLSLINPATAVDEASKGNIEKLVHPQHTMIHLAWSYLSGSWDGIWHQASNYYLTLETSSNIWTLISYDFDETFGTGAPRYMSTTPYSNFSRPDSKRPLVEAFINSPYYRAEFEQVLTTLVKRVFKSSVILPRLEAWTQMLRQEVEWDLTITPKSPGILTQWTLWNFDNNMKFTDGESMGVAEWVETRSTSLQALLNITDVDDLPVLGPYISQSVWDPNNYEKEPVNKNDVKAAEATESGAGKVASSVTLVLLVCIIQLFL